MSAGYSVEDIVRSYRWLGHRGRGFTELNAFHPDYKPGNENFAWNVQQKAFPRVWYTRAEDEVLKFIERHHGERVVCYGLNPRAKIQKNERNFPRSTLDREIEIVQSAFFDFDSESHHLDDLQRHDFLNVLDRADSYFRDLGLAVPVRGFSGRGYHLLFAFPPVPTRAVQDIGARLKAFRNQFHGQFRKEIADAGMRMDSTQDLRRMVRIYGTAKPNVGIISKFYGEHRQEDERLRDYITAMEPPEDEAPTGPGRITGAVLRPQENLPQWFSELLEADGETRQLWNGVKRGPGDNSGSGVDFTLTRRLLYLGHHDLDELATILAKRPSGPVQNGKGENYIRRTIASALVK